jgi:hypothetical protein
VEIKRAVTEPPARRRWLEGLNGVVKISQLRAMIFSGRKIVSTIILRSGETFWLHRRTGGAAAVAAAVKLFPVEAGEWHNAGAWPKKIL